MSRGPACLKHATMHYPVRLKRKKQRLVTVEWVEWVEKRGHARRDSGLTCDHVQTEDYKM